MGFLCTVEFAERNGYVWASPEGDEPGGEETVKVIERVAAGEVPVHGLAEWIGQRLKARDEDKPPPFDPDPRLAAYLEGGSKRDAEKRLRQSIKEHEKDR